MCDLVIVDNNCLLTVGNDSSECSVGENPILNERGDVSVTVSSYVPTPDSVSSSDKSVTCSHCMVRIDNNRLIKYEKMSSEVGTAEGSVGISKSKILVESENRKAWQPSIES